MVNELAWNKRGRRDEDCPHIRLLSKKIVTVKEVTSIKQKARKWRSLEGPLRMCQDKAKKIYIDQVSMMRENWSCQGIEGELGTDDKNKSAWVREKEMKDQKEREMRERDERW